MRICLNDEATVNRKTPELVGGHVYKIVGNLVLKGHIYIYSKRLNTLIDLDTGAVWAKDGGFDGWGEAFEDVTKQIQVTSIL